jgi:serine/threonine-protein kinase
VYGVRGLSGNVRDWCAEKQTIEAEVLSYGGLVPRPEMLEPQPRMAVRGGGWDGGDVATRSAFRVSDILTRRYISLGFRLARSVEGDP